MKVVINRCWGGFGLSEEAVRLCRERGMLDATTGYYYGDENEYRSNPILVGVVEELGNKADGDYAKLCVVEIPFDSTDGWHIHEYDGMESIEEDHRSWR